MCVMAIVKVADEVMLSRRLWRDSAAGERSGDGHAVSPALTSSIGWKSGFRFRVIAVSVSALFGELSLRRQETCVRYQAIP